jgi:hypothetical protein
MTHKMQPNPNQLCTRTVSPFYDGLLDYEFRWAWLFPCRLDVFSYTGYRNELDRLSPNLW